MSYLCPHPCEGRTEYGYCRYTWCINPLHSNLGTAQQGQGVQKQIITNADRIRAMSDEELAEFLWSIGQNPATGNTYLNGKLIFFSGDGNGWLDWLQKEAAT